MTELEEIAQNVIEGNESRVAELTRLALDRGTDFTRVLNEGLIIGMSEVGERMKQAEMFIPEVLLAAKAMNAGMEVLKPLLVEAGSQSIGKVILGTVQGDIHEIGKNLVGIMLRGAGFEVTDLGTGVPPQKFIETARENEAQLIAMSALLTVTMPVLKETIEELKKAGMADQIKTLVGGATVTQKYADEIGASGYAPDAISAVTKAKELLNLN